MKILWVKTDFLHPTNRGGQIRTLEMLRQLHRRHEIHYLALDSGEFPEGPGRAGEYSSFHYAVPHVPPSKTSLTFFAQLVGGLFSPLPVSIARYRSAAMQRQVEALLGTHHFDAIVCDFLFPAINLPEPSKAIVFQHNVEAVIWERHARHGRTPLHRWYFGGQHRRMRAFENRICREAKGVIAVSEADAATFRNDYGIPEVPWVPTGVDVEYFNPPDTPPPPKAELVFIGSMDWMPNIDAARWFADDIFPLIRASRPDCTVAFVGRQPTAAVLALADRVPGLTITGTVPDVRPWLYGGLVSIVPLRIGGGTRLKVYEAMAAGCPVISTSIGAEGLDYRDGENIILADTPAAFAEGCLRLLNDAERRRSLATSARDFVAAHYSWESVAARFEQALVR
ncbi:MAG: glycosyltransferase [Acidobacteriota bacterium]